MIFDFFGGRTDELNDFMLVLLPHALVSRKILESSIKRLSFDQTVNNLFCDFDKEHLSGMLTRTPYENFTEDYCTDTVQTPSE